jgi:hypothetical protein
MGETNGTEYAMGRGRATLTHSLAAVRERICGILCVARGLGETRERRAHVLVWLRLRDG